MSNDFSEKVGVWAKCELQPFCGHLPLLLTNRSIGLC
jgi:hypothetical protein